MGDIKGEMNMYADDISVSETEVKGKLKKIKNSEEYRKFEHSGSLYESDESDDGGAGGCENGGLGGGDKCGDSWV